MTGTLNPFPGSACGARSGGEGGENAARVMERFRLMWNNVEYEPGELKVVAYDSEGKAAAEKTVRTAGKAHSLRIEADRWNSSENSTEECGEELVYLNVSVTDKDGNPVPTDNRNVKIRGEGPGKFVAAANGDPTSLEAFQKPEMHLFNGQLTVIVTRGTEVKVSAKGLRPATFRE